MTLSKIAVFRSKTWSGFERYLLRSFVQLAKLWAWLLWLSIW